MSFPQLFSCPDVVLRIIFSQMGPLEVISLALSSTKTAQTLGNLSLGKRKAEILFEDARTTIMLPDNGVMSSVVVEDCEQSPKRRKMNMISTADSIILFTKLSSVLRLISSVYEMELNFLSMEIESFTDYEELERGFETWEKNADSKLECKNLVIRSLEECEPPRFLETLRIESANLNCHFSKMPLSLLSVKELSFSNASPEDLLKLKCEEVSISQNSITKEHLVSFLNHWKCSTEMEKLKHFSIMMKELDETIFEELGAVKYSETLEEDVHLDRWKLKRVNGKDLGFEKFGTTLIAFTFNN